MGAKLLTTGALKGQKAAHGNKVSVLNSNIIADLFFYPLITGIDWMPELNQELRRINAVSEESPDWLLPNDCTGSCSRVKSMCF